MALHGWDATTESCLTVIAALSWPVLRGLFRLRARGVENLPAGPFVLAANHTSNFDPWPLGLPLFPRRFLRFMAKSELFWFPLSLVIRAGGGFRVRRGEGDVEAIETAVRLCREGHVVVMFPEGTRRKKGCGNATRPRWHSGAARSRSRPRCRSSRRRSAGPTGSAGSALRVAYGAPVSLDGGADDATDQLRDAIETLEATLR